ncbi:hypothetical protein ABK040_016654 [Willaertia magna]
MTDNSCESEPFTENHNLSSYPIYTLMDNSILDNFLNLPVYNKKKVSPIKILPNKEILTISCTENTCFILTKENKIYKSGPTKENEEFIFHVIFQNQLNKTFEKSVVKIESGQLHTLFLTKEGFVFGFGDNKYGQIGFGLNSEIDIPTEIYGLKNIILIQSGVNHSLFLNKNNEIFACGDNDYCQLGDDLVTEGLYKKIILNSISLKENEKIINILCGGYHNFYFTNFNRIFCNGNSDQGQLGLKKDGCITLFLEEQFKIKKIACGCNHTIFLTNNNQIYGLGFNSFNQLSSPSSFLVDTPKRIEINFVKENEFIIDIECGMNHSLFLSNLGNVYGVGSGDAFCLSSDNALIPFRLELPFLEPNEYWEMFSDIYFYGSFFVKRKASKNLLQFYFRLKECIENNLLTDIYFN